MGRLTIRCKPKILNEYINEDGFRVIELAPDKRDLSKSATVNQIRAAIRRSYERKEYKKKKLEFISIMKEVAKYKKKKKFTKQGMSGRRGFNSLHSTKAPAGKGRKH